MKQSIIICLLLVCVHTITKSQSVIGAATYDKVSHAAVVNELPFEPNLTEAAIVAKMKSLGYSPKSSKGFVLFKGVKLNELGPDTYDLYYDIEKKSKKEKDKSIVSLLISKGYDNFADDKTDATLFDNAKIFVNNLVNNAAAADLEKQIAEQEDVLKKATKKYNSSVDDGLSLEKKKRQIEQDIQDNIKDQATKKAEQASQQGILDTLKAKRKS